MERLDKIKLIEDSLFPLVLIDSFSINALDKFQLFELPRNIEKVYLNLDYFTKDVSHILTKKTTCSDSLSVLEFYILGKKRYSYFKGVQSYYIVVMSPEGSDENYASLYSLNFHGNQLSSIIRLADRINSREQLNQVGEIQYESPTQVNFNFNFSFLLDDMSVNDMIIEEIAIKMNNNGYIE